LLGASRILFCLLLEHLVSQLAVFRTLVHKIPDLHLAVELYQQISPLYMSSGERQLCDGERAHLLAC
jgi:hypothetical protein